MSSPDVFLNKVVSTENSETLSVRNFYKNRNILLTGATGFLGKVLLEKLLRSCEDVGTIYVIIRKRKGKTVEERLQKLLSLPVFERVHKDHPEAINKVVAIESDISDLTLGLDERDQKLIEEVISVVFHSAATVKFDEKLKLAVNTNIRGTKHMIDLAMKIKNLKAFVYISTAYSNSDRSMVDEEYYPPNAPKCFWKDLIVAAEKLDERELNALTPKLIGKLPNTYTFTKQMTESLVYDHKDEIPVVILRPSIVAGAFEEPFVGWVDNTNGPTGMLLGYYTGVMSVLLADGECRQDYTGVDFVVNGLIAAACERGQSGLGYCPIYNSTIGKYGKNINFLIENAVKIQAKMPAQMCIWKPKLVIMKSEVLFNCLFVLYHLIPAFLADVILKASGIKFSLTKTYRKIYTLSYVLKFFTMTTIDFEHEKILALHARLSPEEQKIFNFGCSCVVGREAEIIGQCVYGVKRFMLKEDMSEEAIAKLRGRQIYYNLADLAVKTLWVILLLNIIRNFLY